MHDPDFPPKTRLHGGIKPAYGYMPSEDDPLVLIPDPDMVPLIKQALDSIDQGASLREVADWLTTATGKRISHQGINKIWKERRGSDPKNEREKQQKKARKAKAPKTGPEKAKARVKRKIADAKRVKVMQEKKLQNWQDPDKHTPDTTQLATPSVHRETDIDDHVEFSETAVEEANAVFIPNPGPQTQFLAASEQEVLYGGAAGGGKSFGLLADPVRYFSHPEFNGLILRRTNDELRELVWKSQQLYPRAFSKAKWSERKSSWQLPAGGNLWLTYLERPEDVLRYQGQAFSYIAFDELTQHPTPFAWNYMRSRLRTTAMDLPVYQRATTNPGGPGHQWVKSMFIDPAPANEAFWATDIDTGKVMTHPDVYPQGHPQAGQPNPKAGEPLFKRRFIPASLYDNPYLTQDASYESSLLSLPEHQRRQLLEGDWSVTEGAAFAEFRPSVHVVEPFDIPSSWRRFRSCDYGYSSYSAVHWFAVDPAYQMLIVYRELYVSQKHGRDLQLLVRDLERGEMVDYGVLDSSTWHNRGQRGPSIAEEMNEPGLGGRWRPSDRSHGARIAGKNQLHKRLQIDPHTERPGIVFFNTCRKIIGTLPIIPSDPKGGEDIDPRFADDHAYDSVRYGVMSRPRSADPFGWEDVSRSHHRPFDNTFGY
jgi:hypothetical protein